MNILYFATTAFYRKPNPSYHLMYTMISDLLNSGNNVYYVGVASKACVKHIPDEFDNHPNFHYRLVETTPVKRSNFPRRYYNGVRYALKSIKHIKRFIPKCEIVFLQSSAVMAFNVFVARHYAKGQKLVMNVQDMFPGSSIASGVMKQRWLQKAFSYIQKLAYDKSDIIVGISEDMRDKLIAEGVSYEKTDVILNWFDDKTVKFVPWEENRYVRKMNMSKEKFYVQYAGTLGYVFDYKMIIEVARILKPYQDIEIQMIGIGSQKDVFMETAAREKLDNIKFLPLEPQEMVSDVYSACSVCLIPLKHGIIGNSVPSKAGLLMECHKPIVTSVDEGCKYATEINENHIGIACRDDKPEDVANAILKLYKDRELLKTMGENGFKHGHKIYSRKFNMDKYLSLFLKLTK